MRITTWNVNSIRVREGQVLDWLEDNEPELLCMQETKATDQEFPEDGFLDLGYELELYGEANYNGIALACREELEDVRRGLIEDPSDADRRLMSTTVQGVHVVTVYVPNGGTADSDKYAFKLDWLKRLRRHLDEGFDPASPLVLCGDFNIAPHDLDHWWEPSEERQIFTTPEERRAYGALLEWGLVDAYRTLHPDAREYSWWDYRGRTYPRNEGMRIDHLLVTPPVRERLVAVTMDKAMRAAESPSDHIPVTLELQD